MTEGEGFHEGEVVVQERAGVRAEAERLEGMVAPAELGERAAAFLRQQRFAVLTARDGSGRLWVSPLVGPPGFLRGDGAALRIEARPKGPDPLADLSAPQSVGLLVIDFARRRRLRINGTLVHRGPSVLGIAVEQAYGNCPQYIHRRELDHVAAGDESAMPTSESLVDHRDLVEQADTFFLGTAHPSRGSDASHRGGPPGFVRVEGASLSWPDYPGNNMFNSFGNLAVDDEAGLLFVDFADGRTLHLSGRAEVEWLPAGAHGDDGDTGRRVRFTPERIVAARATARARSDAG
jgi:predicted pyridoxine 5'-phosphate oxidase superfamily flavin-nucleotide-binding protein